MENEEKTDVLVAYQVGKVVHISKNIVQNFSRKKFNSVTNAIRFPVNNCNK
jgi:hypothetical protein